MDLIIMKKINYYVFDLGGRTYDIYILTIEKNKFQVLVNNGNTNLWR
jgi:molecular chaperone DnaK (HSP70)